jgi:hypothetical protein
MCRVWMPPAFMAMPNQRVAPPPRRSRPNLRGHDVQDAIRRHHCRPMPCSRDCPFHHVWRTQASAPRVRFDQILLNAAGRPSECPLPTGCRQKRALITSARCCRADGTPCITSGLKFSDTNRRSCMVCLSAVPFWSPMPGQGRTEVSEQHYFARLDAV